MFSVGESGSGSQCRHVFPAGLVHKHVNTDLAVICAPTWLKSGHTKGAFTVRIG